MNSERVALRSQVRNDGSRRAGLTLKVERWSGASVRFCSVLALFALAGCPKDQPAVTQCELRIEVPLTVTTPVGSSTDFTVRFFNPTAKPVQVSALSTAAPFSFRNGSSDFVIGPGTCEAPGEVGLVMAFSPTTFGVQRGSLTMLLDGAPRSIDLSAMATGPLLSAANVVTFGATGLAPSASRPLALRNVGTEGTSLEVDVVTVSATNATTTAAELCVGSVELGVCQPTSRVTVRRDASFSLSVVPTSTGPKSWSVELRAGDTTWTTRVLATVVDTHDCQLSADPSVLDFGLVAVPKRTVRSTTLRNSGSTSCVVTAARTNDSRFEVVSAQRTIPAGGAQVVSVEALENKPPQTKSTLIIELARSAPGPIETLEVGLETAAPAGCLIVSPNPITFGRARTDCQPPMRTILLINRCAAPFHVSVSTVGPFSIVGASSPFQTLLQPAQPVGVLLGFSVGAATGSTSGALRVEFGRGQETLVALGGVIESPELMTDTFAFDARFLNDTIIILDDSPSFARQHPNTRAELDRLASYLSATNEVFSSRVAFTTTDVTATGPRGRFRSTDGGQRWASGDDPSFRSTFAALSTLSTSGAERGSCIEAAARAVTEPLRTDPQGNGDFARQNAFLSLLCVTDDVEHASDPAAWRRQLESLDAGIRLSYSVMGPFGSACPVDALDVDGGHVVSVNAFRGTWSDVCRPWQIYGLTGRPSRRTDFRLTGTPVVASLRVTLGGVELLRESGTQSNWSYDDRSNRITISPSLLGLDPPTVTVSYRTVCPY